MEKGISFQTSVPYVFKKGDIMYSVDINIAKYNLKCFISTAVGDVISRFSFDNSVDDFNLIHKILHSLLAKIKDIHEFSNPKNPLALSSIKFILSDSRLLSHERHQGKHHKEALDAISRKLIRLIYHLETIKIIFDMNQLG